MVFSCMVLGRKVTLRACVFGSVVNRLLVWILLDIRATFAMMIDLLVVVSFVDLLVMMFVRLCRYAVIGSG